MAEIADSTRPTKVLSRRALDRVVWCFATLLLFVGVASAQEPHRIFRVPFHSANGMILLEAKIDGQKATLILDTGASRSMVAPAYCVADCRKTLQHRSFQGIESKAVEVVTGQVAIELGESLTSTHAIVRDTGPLASANGRVIDGLIGQDVLRMFSAVRIDFKNHVVELESAR